MPEVVTKAPVRIGWRREEAPEALVSREWLLSNGLGGYASGTLSGIPSRRFHGLLIAALPAPHGRTMMVNHVSESLARPGSAPIALTGRDSGVDALVLPEALVEFRLENGRPIWHYEQDGVVLEKRVVVTHRQNTTRVYYRLLASPAPLTLVLEPALAIRPHDGRVDGLVEAGDGSDHRAVATQGAGHAVDDQAAGQSAGRDIQTVDGPNGPAVVVAAGQDRPALRLAARASRAATFTAAPRDFDVRYRVEQARGYDHRGQLHAIGRFEIPLAAGEEAVLIASTEAEESVEALHADEAATLDDERRLRLLNDAHPGLRRGLGAELVLAADQFVITPHTRPADEVRLHAEGDEARTVIAGYHWFTDWGRDTMISLEGLTLLTGRQTDARAILHTFAHHVRDGLIPNMFPEGKSEGLYHTADATLWFFHALDRYERTTGDVESRRFFMPTLVDIIRKHVAGTRFGIRVDPTDGLLHQGAEGYQLTWMDAKVGDWVVTPRRGKAVEINALFYNALMLMTGWLREEEALGPSARNHGLSAAEVEGHAARLREAFNRRFWNPVAGCLLDVVDAEGGGDDSSLRPNQILAISLPHPVLDRDRWQPVLQVVRERLVTPFGLRSLAPGHPDYKSRYDGDLRARDAAYHQGTIWGWLMGPFVDAWLKTFPDDGAGARRLLEGLESALASFCIGTIGEIYDAEAPFTPRGCVSQAWSVAESLRALLLIGEPGA
jgi:predicted glycogen debranching enzyme